MGGKQIYTDGGSIGYGYMSPKAHIVRMPSEVGRKPDSEMPFLGSVDFSYSKNLFFLRLILETVMIALVAVTISPLFLDVPLAWMAGILALLSVYIFFSAVSPFLTSHTLTPYEMIVRQGWYFKATIPIEDIESIEPTDEFVFTGVKFSIMDQKVYVTGSRHGLVKITLKRRRRFIFALGKLAKVVIIDLNNRQRFMELANKVLEPREPLIPASPDQSFLLQS
jgi:hypothetical protein